MGNRGVLHDSQGQIRRAWKLKRWIVCVLDFKGRKRKVMSPGQYTELFFLDEATALAAGHRPCSECQRPRFVAFREAWASALGSQRPAASEIDDRLHEDRLAPNGSKRTFVASLDEVPDGVFVTTASCGDQPLMVLGDSLLRWTPAGYSERHPRTAGEEAMVLTPSSTVEAIRAGYSPEIHHSAVQEFCAG
jgi:hypothetical protein